MNKTEFQKKWENFWYYYKWHTIAGVFVLLLVSVFIKDMVTKEKYDATVMLATSYYVDDAKTEQLKATLEPYFTDIDGNGEVNLFILPIYMEGGVGSESGDMQHAYAMQMKMVSEISVNPSMIFIFDEGFTDTFVNQMEARNLEADFPDNPLIQGTCWDIAASEIGGQTFIAEYEQAVGSKYYASITNGTQVKKEAEVVEYEAILQAFHNMINNTNKNAQ